MSASRKRIDARDKREFKFGEIYLTKDKLVNFPEETIVKKRTYHNKRMVVITQHCDSNFDPNIWTLNAAPLSTQIHMKRDTDLEIEPCEGNYIDRTSLIRLGASQPFLKIDLEGPVGRLSEKQQKMLSALLLRLAGVL